MWGYFFVNWRLLVLDDVAGRGSAVSSEDFAAAAAETPAAAAVAAPVAVVRCSRNQYSYYAAGRGLAAVCDGVLGGLAELRRDSARAAAAAVLFEDGPVPGRTVRAHQAAGPPQPAHMCRADSILRRFLNSGAVVRRPTRDDDLRLARVDTGLVFVHAGAALLFFQEDAPRELLMEFSPAILRACWWTAGALPAATVVLTGRRKALCLGSAERGRQFFEDLPRLIDGDDCHAFRIEIGPLALVEDEGFETVEDSLGNLGALRVVSLITKEHVDSEVCKYPYLD